MIESRAEATAWKHHKQKLVLAWSAMRQFAEQLSREGLKERPIGDDDFRNTGSVAAPRSQSRPHKRAAKRGGFSRPRRPNVRFVEASQHPLMAQPRL